MFFASHHPHHHHNLSIRTTITSNMQTKRQIRSSSAVAASKVMRFAAAAAILVIAGAVQQSLATTLKPDAILVKTSSGLLAGSQVQLQNITTQLSQSAIYKFLSVPYAQAPIGRLRFQKPVAINKQNESDSDSVIDVGQMGPTCAQLRHLTNFISPLLNVDHEHQVSEDCLHLHMYVPSQSLQQATGHKLKPTSSQKSLLPVIVWIPGEGFDYADARQFDGSQLAATSNAIVISVQYRVGVLGFLSEPAWNVTGNMGLFDQLAALQWINSNVENFGGDPSNVSLMGRFTGAMSISSLLTAPKQDLIRVPSSGQLLFKRVALLSGVTVDRWIIDEHQDERARALVEQAVERSLCAQPNNNNQSSLSGDLECLQSLPVDQLIRMADYAWRPSRDNQLIGELMPAEAVKAGQYPADLESILLGETAAEGSLCLMRHMLTQSTRYGELLESGKLNSEDLYDMIRDDSQFYFKHQLAKSNPIQRALEQMARDSTDLTSLNKIPSDSKVNEEGDDGEDLRAKYITACSSFLIKYHTEEFKKSILAKNKLAETRLDITRKPIDIYHYELTYRPSFSLAPAYIKTSSHGDDVPLIFGLVFNEAREKVSPQDLSMSLNMMQLISGFAHGKKPQLKQQRLTSTSIGNVPKKSLSKRRVHGSSQLERQQQLPSWSNEGKKMKIQWEKEQDYGDEHSLFSGDEVMTAPELGEERALELEKKPRMLIGEEMAANDKIMVFIEREAKQSIERLHHQIMPTIDLQHQRQQPHSSWSRKFSSSQHNDARSQRQQLPTRYLSRSYDTSVDNDQSAEWTSPDSIDLTRQHSASAQLPPGDASKSSTQLESNNNHHHGVVLLITLGGLIMAMMVLALGFSLMRLQRKFNCVCKLLDHHKRLMRLDNNQNQNHHEDDSSQGLKSDAASLDAVLAVDSSQHQHHNHTKSGNRPFCNMLNKLSNIPNHNHHHHHDTLHSNLNDLDAAHNQIHHNHHIAELETMATKRLTKGQQHNHKLDLQGSSIALARRNSNSSDQIALRINHETFNHHS